MRFIGTDARPDWARVMPRFALGELYEHGDEVERDPARAYFWYELAVRANHATATGARDWIADQLAPAERVEAERLLRIWEASK